MAHVCERSRAGGAVASNICCAATHYFRWTALGVARSAVDNELSPEIFFLYGEEEADKICSGSCGWACSGRVEGILDNGELAILEEERAFVGVVAAPEVPPWPEEKEESDPG